LIGYRSYEALGGLGTALLETMTRHPINRLTMEIHQIYHPNYHSLLEWMGTCPTLVTVILHTSFEGTEGTDPDVLRDFLQAIQGSTSIAKFVVHGMARVPQAAMVDFLRRNQSVVHFQSDCWSFLEQDGSKVKNTEQVAQAFRDNVAIPRLQLNVTGPQRMSIPRLIPMELL
jgi:hypothetical protein